MKQAQTTEQQEQSKQPKQAKEPRLEIPLWLIQRAQREGLSRGHMLAYAWLFHKNRYGHIVYAKHTLTELWIEMRSELLMPNATKTCQLLEERGWIAKAVGEPYKGRTMKGYRCLLSAAAKVEQKAEQQELQLQDEQAVTVVESAVSTGRTIRNEEGAIVRFNDGMYHLGHKHWYLIDAIWLPDEQRWVSEKGDTEGNRQYVPEQFAFNRPSTAHIFDTEGQRWCLPGEETIPPMEY